MSKILETGCWNFVPNRQTFDWVLADNLVEFLKEENIKSAYDFGCGVDAFYVKYFNMNGLDVSGCECNSRFSETIRRNVAIENNSKRPERSKQINKALSWHDSYILKSPGIFKKLYIADLTKELYLHDIPEWGISLEVAEHIPAKYEHTYLDNLIRNSTKGLILSWAKVNQKGIGHVNCKNKEDVIAELSDMGLKYDEAASKKLSSGVIYKHFKNTMVFRK